MDASLSPPLKSKTSVKCSWREEALLNRGSSASKTWPPFPGAAGALHPALCHADMLSAQTDARRWPRSAALRPPRCTRIAACWCFALALCITPLSLKKQRWRETTETCATRAACRWMICTSLSEDTTWGSHAGAAPVWTFGLPPQRALQHLGGVGVVVLGQDEDDLEDTKEKTYMLMSCSGALNSPKSINECSSKSEPT